MDYFREMLNMGGNIMDQVNDAIEKNDYSGLAKEISDEVAQFTRNTMNQSRKKVTYTRTVRNPDGSHTTFKYTPADIDLGTRGTGRPQHKSPNQYQGRQTQNRGSQGQRQNAQGGSGFWGGGYSNYKTPGGSGPQNWSQGQSRPQGQQNYQAQGRPQYQQRPQTPPQGATTTAITPFNKYKSGGAWSGGLMKQVIGGTGLAFTVPSALSFVAAAAATGPAALIGAAIFGAGAGVSAYVFGKGGKQKKLAKTFDKYSKAVGNAEYITIEDLSEKTFETEEEVQANIDKMIDAGMLPQAKFDTGKTTMMLTKNAYDQYLLAEDARKARKEEEAELDAKMGSPEARKVIEEGESFVVRIKAANDAIPGEEMTDKLNQMERIVSKIFAQVRKEPASAADLRKFMNYYLPTTEKLLNAYIDLDRQPEVGENIKNTKREIEETVDTINDAFENLLDSLFQDVRWDITSDISVMKTMMEQDGLMDKKELSQDHSPDPIPDVKDAVNGISPEKVEPISEEPQVEDEPLSEAAEDTATEEPDEPIKPSLKFGE